MDSLANSQSSPVRIFMFPYSDCQPAYLGEHYLCFAVTLAISQDLRPPEFRIRSGPSPVLRTSVPEASIDEHRHAGSEEHNIGDSPNLRKWTSVHSVAHAQSA
jgi:hypothetical protein